MKILHVVCSLLFVIVAALGILANLHFNPALAKPRVEKGTLLCDLDPACMSTRRLRWTERIKRLRQTPIKWK